MIKKLFRLLVTIIFTAVVAVSSFYLSRYLREILFQTGVLREEILIAGTGSMYPTFPKSEGEDDVQKAQEIVAWPKMRRYGTPISILAIFCSEYANSFMCFGKYEIFPMNTSLSLVNQGMFVYNF